MSSSAYSDLSRPPLHEAGLARALVVAGGLWRQVRVLPETGSTNADVVAAAQAGEAEGLVVVAESQTAGRGRLDRHWVAPPRSSLMLSVLLRPAAPVARWGWLPLLAGVAVVEAVARVAVVDVRLKWPNDVLLRSASADGDGAGVEFGFGKGAGVLAEGVPGEGVVIGIGLNVSQRADELPPPIAGGYPATSLALAGAASTDRDPLLRALLRALATWYDRWNAAGGDPEGSGLREVYRSLCATIGATVEVSLPGGAVVGGVARDVDGDGRLVVATATGERALAAGDVRHVR